MKKLFLILSFLIYGATSVFAQDFDQIIKTIDDLQNFEDMDLSLIFTMVSQKPGKDKSVTKIQVFRRDSEEKLAYLTLKPEVDKGSGLLMVEDNAWLYDPSSRKFSHVSMKENIGDTEARNDDMRSSSLADDYDIVDSEESKLGKIPTYTITLVANNNEVATPKLKLWVRQDNYLPLKQEDYSVSDRLVRTTLMPKWTTVSGRYIPTKQLMLDNLKDGEKTQISLSDISNAQIPDDVFTKAYLERINNK